MNPPDFTKDIDDLCSLFVEHNIPTQKPGFYDHPNFKAIEENDPAFLNCHARFVQQRPRDKAYDDRVKKLVPQIAKTLHQELEAEGRLGACVDLSMVFSRILDEEGIWNYVVKGALVLTFPRSITQNPIYFWPIDVYEGPSKDGHVWVSAPPFDVIDLTVRQQPYPNPAMRGLLEPFILLDRISPVKPERDDIVSAEAQALYLLETGNIPPDLHLKINPDLPDVFAAFSANEQRVGRVRMRYVPCGFGASEDALGGITNQRWNGRYGFEIYQDLIKGKI